MVAESVMGMGKQGSAFYKWIEVRRSVEVNLR